ncbi:MAG: penicillin-binding transpeptidase domain-containing protein, partial [Armatimonadia bacterium]
IRQMLENAVQNGTGKPVKMPDFRVGGKTGTAQQWDPQLGRYTDRYMMSFIEVAPIDVPRYVIWVACSDPKVGRHGSDTAAPAAKHIAEYALRQLTPPQPAQ